MAIVSLKSQQVTIYDADGWILRAPVSTGQKGRETPAGVFSVIQKEAEHYSNLYDDASMPHMERITWSGIHWNQNSARNFCTCTGSPLETQMACTPAQRALDQAQSTAFMRNFYASLGMRKLTLERAIRHSKGFPVADSAPVPRRRPGRPRSPAPS
jgi:hypothetical protein